MSSLRIPTMPLVRHQLAHWDFSKHRGVTRKRKADEFLSLGSAPNGALSGDRGDDGGVQTDSDAEVEEPAVVPQPAQSVQSVQSVRSVQSVQSVRSVPTLQQPPQQPQHTSTIRTPMKRCASGESRNSSMDSQQTQLCSPTAECSLASIHTKPKPNSVPRYVPIPAPSPVSSPLTVSAPTRAPRTSHAHKKSGVLDRLNCTGPGPVTHANAGA